MSKTVVGSLAIFTFLSKSQFGQQNNISQTRTLSIQSSLLKYAVSASVTVGAERFVASQWAVFHIPWSWHEICMSLSCAKSPPTVQSCSSSPCTIREKHLANIPPQRNSTCVRVLFCGEQIYIISILVFEDLCKSFVLFLFFHTKGTQAGWKALYALDKRNGETFSIYNLSKHCIEGL